MNFVCFIVVIKRACFTNAMLDKLSSLLYPACDGVKNLENKEKICGT